MKESNNLNQNDNQSAFETILTKYSNLLIEVDQLRKDNKNLEAKLSSYKSVPIDKELTTESQSISDLTLGKLKQELSQIKSSVNKMVDSNKEAPQNPAKRKRKSSKKSIWKRLKSAIDKQLKKSY